MDEEGIAEIFMDDSVLADVASMFAEDGVCGVCSGGDLLPIAVLQDPGHLCVMPLRWVPKA